MHLASTPVGEDEPIVMPARRLDQDQIAEQGRELGHVIQTLAASNARFATRIAASVGNRRRVLRSAIEAFCACEREVAGFRAIA